MPVFSSWDVIEGRPCRPHRMPAFASHLPASRIRASDRCRRHHRRVTALARCTVLDGASARVWRLEIQSRWSEGSGPGVRGRVASVSASALTLNVDGAQRRFEPNDVAQVRRNSNPLFEDDWLSSTGMGAFGILLERYSLQQQKSYPATTLPEDHVLRHDDSRRRRPRCLSSGCGRLLYTAPNRPAFEELFPSPAATAPACQYRIDFTHLTEWLRPMTRHGESLLHLPRPASCRC